MLRHIADACLQGGRETTQRILGKRAKVLEPYAPFLRDLDGVADLPGLHSVGPKAARERLFFALNQTLTDALERGPALLLFDDLHRADELSLAALANLRRWVREHQLPWMLLGMYASEAPRADLHHHILSAAGWEHRRLERLDRAAVAELTGQMLGVSAPPRELVDLIAQHSAGNPYFVAEYLRGALDQNLMELDDEGRWQLPEVARLDEAGLALPDSIDHLVRHRIDALDAAARDVCRALSVLGRAADSGTLATFVRQPRAKLRRRLATLQRREILERTPEGIVFVHEQLRQASYRTLEDDARRALHARAAEWLVARGEATPAQLANHRERAGEPARALTLYLEGARRAVADAALGQADELFERALALTPPCRATRADAGALARCLDAYPGGRARWRGGDRGA